MVDKNSYVQTQQKKMNYIVSNETTDHDRVEDVQREVGRLVDNLYRNGAISNNLKQNLIPRYAQTGRLIGNPQLQKPNDPYLSIDFISKTQGIKKSLPFFCFDVAKLYPSVPMKKTTCMQRSFGKQVNITS